MIWDPFQQEMLAALGHTLYVSVDATAMRAEDEPVDTRAAGSSVRESNAIGTRYATSDVRPRNTASPDALMRALLRAANLGEEDAQLLQSRLPPLGALSGNAAAKRTSWPSLRALRAQRRT